MIGTGEVTSSKRYLWYSLGSGLFAISTLLMTIVVSQITGEKVGGMFSIGLSVAQWLVTIAYYEIRTYQVTDVRDEFEFFNYFSLRMIMCFLAFGICIVYVFVNGYSMIKIEIVLLLCFYKILEGIADIFEGEFQRKSRIDISGKSMFIRTLISMITLIVSLIFTKNIVISLVLMNVTCATCVYILNFSILKRITKIKLSFEFVYLRKLIIYCFPLAVSTFLSTYIINSSKLAVDKVLGDEYQLYYTAVFMPNLVINLFSGIIFKPMQTTMAIRYNNNEKKLFRQIVFKLCGIIIGFTMLCIIGAYILGIPVLSMLYGIDLSDYKIVLLILLLSGGVNAVNIVFYYVMTIMRKQKFMIPIYLVVSLVSFIIMNPMVEKYNLIGAAISYLIIVLLLELLLILCIVQKGDNKKYE